MRELLNTHLGPAPPYCAGRTMVSKPLTPPQWAVCAKYGWHEPTTAVGHAGYMTGHYIWLVLLVAVVATLAVRGLVGRGRRLRARGAA